VLLRQLAAAQHKALLNRRRQEKSCYGADRCQRLAALLSSSSPTVRPGNPATSK
jgi:hypothetical protein